MRGFTLIEILIVIALVLILAALISPIYGNFQSSGQLNDNVTQIVQYTRTARERSVARLNDSSHGVFFDVDPTGDDKYVLYQGSSYATRFSSYDREVLLDSIFSLSTTLAGDEVNFSKGLGIPNTTGIITLTHEISGAKMINVHSYGLVEE
jgi:prepilin-type N-terminal cleavage/methylation domain-containing protein